MKIIHLSGFSEQEKTLHKSVIHLNILTYMKTLLQASHRMDNRLGKRNKVRLSIVLTTPAGDQKPSGTPFGHKFASTTFYFSVSTICHRGGSSKLISSLFDVEYAP